MKTVLLRMNGPLMSWGLRSHYALREAGMEPSMSGSLGLVAAALGMPRDDDARLKRLAAAWVGVRCDREAREHVDFHTVGGGDVEHRVRGAEGAVLTERTYLEDGNFLVGLGFDDHDLADEVDAALEDPVWTLFLGRKACPASPHLRAGLVNADCETALRAAPWPWPDRPEERVRLVLESPYGQGEPRNDHPLSFRPEAREYRRRWVTTHWIAPEALTLRGEAPPPAAVETTRWAGRNTRRDPVRPVVDVVHVTHALLNPMSRDVQHALLDVHAMHRRVLSAFPVGPSVGGEGARARHRVLYRVDSDPRAGRFVLLVQSATEPKWGTFPDGYLVDVSPLRLMGHNVSNPATTLLSWPNLEVGAVFGFKVRGNPVTHRRTISRPRAWIDEAMIRAGVELLEVTHADEPAARGSRPNPPGVDPDRLTFASVFFEGRLRVVDPDALRAALVGGVGRGKAFGFGLVTLDPRSG